MLQNRKDVQEFIKGKIAELLQECTEPQREFFKKLYGDVSKIPANKLEAAIDIVERTIIKNRKGRNAECTGQSDAACGA